MATRAVAIALAARVHLRRTATRPGTVLLHQTVVLAVKQFAPRVLARPSNSANRGLAIIVARFHVHATGTRRVVTTAHTARVKLHRAAARALAVHTHNAVVLAVETGLRANALAVVRHFPVLVEVARTSVAATRARLAVAAAHPANFVLGRPPKWNRYVYRNELGPNSQLYVH